MLRSSCIKACVSLLKWSGVIDLSATVEITLYSAPRTIKISPDTLSIVSFKTTSLPCISKSEGLRSA